MYIHGQLYGIPALLNGGENINIGAAGYANYSAARPNVSVQTR